MPFQNRTVLSASLLSGWASMTGRLLLLFKDTATRYFIGRRTKVS